LRQGGVAAVTGEETNNQTMDKMVYGDDYHFIPMTSVNSGEGFEVVRDVYGLTVQIVNVAFLGSPASRAWVLVDAGMPGSAEAILDAAEERFGENCPPRAIVLTHGHFDHVGAVIELVERWGCPVYANEAELPHLTGKLAYPEPDASVEGGLVAKMSPFFPNEPIDLGRHVRPLPVDGSVPDAPGWRWLHTPGHSRGHVSLFREADRTLVAGDAFVTVKQDALYKVLTQQPEVCGPPRYLTPDWQGAWESVKRLAELKPKAALTGHGIPLYDEELAEGLAALTRDFERVAIPDYGKFVGKQ
jgi:glyoxylase-like metal-dependent hydrolase (beta-lactamase superfamily II)